VSFHWHVLSECPDEGACPIHGINEPPCSFRAAFHWPRIYRYEVAYPGLRLAGNRYGTALIGLALVAGSHAYCVKWANARTVMP
jgi:hypothetical protein